MGDERRRTIAVSGVAVLAALAVVGVWAAGPTRWSVPRWRVSQRPLPPATPIPQASASPPAVRDLAPPAGVQYAVSLILIVAACLVMLLILYALLRRLRPRRRVRRDVLAEGLEVAPALGDEPDAAPEAAPVARGIARALQILDEERTADDAIVRAWLGLEDAAVASGAGRRPAETPGEYAARIIRRFEADGDAVDTLLDLYQGVRFGGRHGDAAAIDTARECLRRLAASWHEDAAVGRR